VDRIRLNNNRFKDDLPGDSPLTKLLIPDYSFLRFIQKLRCIKLEAAKYFVKQNFEKLEMISGLCDYFYVLYSYFKSCPGLVIAL